MKKRIFCMVSLLLCWIIAPVYITEAAIYKTGRYSDISTYAMALDMFPMNGNRYFVGIYKDCISIPGRSDFYEYVITFDQPNNNYYINVSKIIVVSESSSIIIDSGFKPNRNIGLESIFDTLRTTDTGRFNMVLLTAQSKMLIRVIDKNNYSYDFYASKDFIEKCKIVANWS